MDSDSDADFEVAALALFFMKCCKQEFSQVVTWHNAVVLGCLGVNVKKPTGKQFSKSN